MTINDCLALTITDTTDGTETDYRRVYRGADAGLWRDESGDILGDDDDMSKYLAENPSLVAYCNI